MPPTIEHVRQCPEEYNSGNRSDRSQAHRRQQHQAQQNPDDLQVRIKRSPKTRLIPRRSVLSKHKNRSANKHKRQNHERTRELSDLLDRQKHNRNRHHGRRQQNAPHWRHKRLINFVQFLRQQTIAAHRKRKPRRRQQPSHRHRNHRQHRQHGRQQTSRLSSDDRGQRINRAQIRFMSSLVVNQVLHRNVRHQHEHHEHVDTHHANPRDENT